MAPSDLDQLVDMGFDKEKAQMALKKSGGLMDAVDWLGANSEKSLDELKAEEAESSASAVPEPGPDAKSLVCNECGKKFRGTAAAEFHATKTEHTDFSESTEEIAPLTEEEKKAKLAELRERLAEKRAGLSEQEKADKKRNEEINRKKTKETQDMKEDLKVKEAYKEAEKKRKEKADDIAAKKRIQAKIAADKEERRLKTEKEKAQRAGLVTPQEAAPAAAPVIAAAPTSKPASAYTETRLRLQTANGSVTKTFPVETTLFEVAAALNEESGMEVESFTQNFPKKIFNSEFFGETLKDLKLVPSASLVVNYSSGEQRDYGTALASTFLMSVTTAIETRQGVPSNMLPKSLEPAQNMKDTPLPSEHDHFFWTYTEEPHRTRRQAIIKAHPEVTKLCGPEPRTKYLVVLVVGIQILCAYLLRNSHVFSWPFLLTAYMIGATANQNLFLAIHEISHNLAFRNGFLNRLLAIFANLPIGIPYSAGFRPYHLTHHKSLGVDGLDTDLPTAYEAIFLDSVLGKTFFCTFQIIFYAIRPMVVYKMPFTSVHWWNIVAQVSFDLAMWYLVGPRTVAYFVISSFLAGSLHPCAAHFIAEHYVLMETGKKEGDISRDVPVPETYSYYGPLNMLTYNVGYHNEHHDFPAVPWTRLPKLHSIAKEFYEPLPHHRSWPYVLVQFILDKEVGLWCRVKRAEGGRLVGSWKENEVQN